MSNCASQVQLVDSIEGVASLGRVWDDLSSVTPLTSAFESWSWISTCCEQLPRPGAELQVMVVSGDPGGEPSAIFPMSIDTGGFARFVGADVGSYCGPVYDPDLLEPSIRAWAAALSSWRQVKALDLRGLRGGSPFAELVMAGLPGWGAPRIAETDVAFEIDLGGGPESVLVRRSSKTRSTLRRRWRELGRRGRLDFVCFSDPEEVLAALPRLFELFTARWEGQRVSGGFIPRLQPFHRAATRRLAEHGAVDLMALCLDGVIISYSFGLRAGAVTTGYVTAYDASFSDLSPGALLQWRVLEAAAERGDPAFDMSVGEFGYKAAWGLRRRPVYRLRWGRGRRLLSTGDRLRTRARSSPLLRDLKLRGPAALRDRMAPSSRSGAPR